jgi:integrase
MIELQRLTGMRPGEACSMRAGDIDTAGVVWMYRPARHKLAWRGRIRVVPLGPKAQGVVRPFLDTAGGDYLFSPARAMAAYRAGLRKRRKTPVQPSQQCRRVDAPKRRPGEKYTTQSYGRAIADACRRVGVPVWHPNQLRHAYATAVRRAYGVEGPGRPRPRQGGRDPGVHRARPVPGSADCRGGRMRLWRAFLADR